MCQWIRQSNFEKLVKYLFILKLLNVYINILYFHFYTYRYFEKDNKILIQFNKLSENLNLNSIVHCETLSRRCFALLNELVFFLKKNSFYFYFLFLLLY